MVMKIDDISAGESFRVVGDNDDCVYYIQDGLVHGGDGRSSIEPMPIEHFRGLELQTV